MILKTLLHLGLLLRPGLSSLLLVSAALALLTGCKRSNGAISYGTAPVARGEVVQHVTASGTLNAVLSVDVGCQVSGKIASLGADYNSEVKKGQLIAEIDPTTYEAALRQAQGDLDSAKAEVTVKRQNLERKKVLVPIKADSQLNLDAAVAELAEAEATVTIKQAALESAQANLSYCKITAPMDGIVIARKVDLGQTVNAAMNTPEIFIIAQDISKMNIYTTVSEADIGQVKDGQSVEFSVEAFPDDSFQGVVTQVRKDATNTANVITYQVVVSVENPEQKLFPGMTADVSILVAQHTNVFKIPNTALRYSPPDNVVYEQKPPAKLERKERLVYLPGKNPGQLKPAVVKVGITDSVDTEILDGLAEGVPVVTSTLSGIAKSNEGGGPPPP
jgi:HlyD family secretion protein